MLTIAPELMGLLIVVVVAVLSAAFSVLAARGRFRPTLRAISAYKVASDQIGEAIESGGRVHVSVGPRSIVSERAITVLMGLAFLDRVAEGSAISDHSPIGTTADAATLPLVADTLRRAYQRRDMIDRLERTAPRLVALDSLALAAGTTDIIADEDVQANVVVGSFGHEGILITEAGMRHGLSQTMGSDLLAGQAVAYTTVEHPLLGEELFMARAYLQEEAAALGSLATQDILRWVIIIAIIVGVALQTLAASR